MQFLKQKGSVRQIFGIGVSLAMVMSLVLNGHLLDTNVEAAENEQLVRALIPQPLEYTVSDGHFTLGENTHFVVDANEQNEEVKNSTNVIVSEFRKSTGYALPIVEDETNNGDVVIRITDNADIPEEGYTLHSTEQKVVIEASTSAGAFYGMQTLRQLLPNDVEKNERVKGVDWFIPCATITDKPEYGYRGVQLDVARHFFEVSDVKRQIDVMAQYKINKLHMHLSDDQGWRLEIKNTTHDGKEYDYSNLTKLGASTSCSTNGYKPGYYTQEQFRNLIQYAKERHVEIIPEFDMPSHAWAALVSLPLLNSTEDGLPASGNGYDKTKPYEGWDVGFNSMECRNENTYLFIEDVIKQLDELLPEEFNYIHIGGDEAHNTPHEDYLYFMNRVTEIVQKYGRTPYGWQNYDEVVRDVIKDKDNAVVQYWSTNDKPCMEGVKYVASPADHAYMDMKYDSGCKWGLEWATHNPVDDAYNWDPTDFASKDQIVGIEAPIFTETISDNEALDYMYYPRLVGYAEIGWTPKEKRDWNEYKVRLEAHGDRFTNLGIKYRRDSLVWYNPIDMRLPMDEAEGTTIKDTTGQYKGSLVNGVSWIDGKYAKGLYFDGNGYVDLNYPDVRNEWTAGMWVKREDSGSTNATLLSGNEGEIKLEQWKNTGKVGISKYGDSDVTFNYEAPVGEWVHLAFTGNVQGTTLYVNGVKTDHVDLAIQGPANRLGANSRDGLADRGCMKGTLDDVQIYSRVLTDSEITEMMKDPFGFGEEIKFKMDENQGDVITDTTGNYSVNLGKGIDWVEGKNGSGLHFNGSSFVELGYRDLDKTWTAAMWVKREETTGTNAVLLSGIQGEIKLDQWNKTGKVGITQFRVEDATFNYEAPIGEWVHLTFVGDETGTTLYVNGKETDKVSLSINGPASRLGAETKEATGYLSGTLDNLQIYDRALSKEEIAEIPGANKDALKEAVAEAKELDMNNYTASTKEVFVTALKTAQDVLANEEAKQEEVDKALENLQNAIASLEYKDADYSAVEEAINKANSLDKNLYKDFSKVEEAINQVVRDLDITKQAEVDAMAKAINDAVNALEYKDADYSKVDEILSSIPKDLDNYTEESVKALKEALDAVVRDLDITHQEEVDEMAANLLEAIKGLQLKEQQPETPGDKPENPETPGKEEDDKGDVQTGVTSNAGAFAGMLAVAGGAILIAMKKREEVK